MKNVLYEKIFLVDNNINCNVKFIAKLILLNIVAGLYFGICSIKKSNSVKIVFQDNKLPIPNVKKKN